MVENRWMKWNVYKCSYEIKPPICIFSRYFYSTKMEPYTVCFLCRWFSIVIIQTSLIESSSSLSKSLFQPLLTVNKIHIISIPKISNSNKMYWKCNIIWNAKPWQTFVINSLTEKHLCNTSLSIHNSVVQNWKYHFFDLQGVSNRITTCILNIHIE